MKPAFPLLYVAGPYRGPSRDAVELNIQAARAVAVHAARKGYAVLIPHSNTSHLEHVLPELGDEYWLATTMAMMRKCEAVVLVPGWKRSHGTLAEIEEAQRLGIPVFYSVDEMPEAPELARA